MRNDLILWSLILVVHIAAWSTTHAQDPVSPYTHQGLTETIAACQHQPRGPELPVGELALDPDESTRRSISRSAAATDVDRFFHLLEHGYCGYGYFSRENDFGAAREEILAELHTRSDWPTREFAELVRKHLDFVADCHLKLGYVQFASHQDFWFVPDLVLTERRSKFYLGDHQNVQLLVSVNGCAPEEFAFRSLDPDGRPTHILGVLSASEPLPLRVKIETAGGVSERRYSLTRAIYSRSDLFRFFRLGGIPVVRISTFSDHHAEEIADFLSTADELRDEPCVIVDLRTNGGGNTRWPREWIRRFTGRTPQLHQVLTELVSRTALVGQMNYLAWLATGPGRAIQDRLEKEREKLAFRVDRFNESGAQPCWQAPYVPGRPPIPNEVTLVVVIDAAVASSGEGFISYLHDQVENVVLVGENTRGALTFGHMAAHRLPESGLMAFLPVKLNLPLDMNMREERGFDPDYWVPAADALNRAVAAIRAGTIPTVKPLPPAVLATEFVPESTLPFSREQTRHFLQVMAVIMVGILFGIVSRRRGPLIFVICAAGLVAAGAFGFADNPPARWLALLTGVGNAIVAGCKSWSAQRARAHRSEDRRDLPEHD